MSDKSAIEWTEATWNPVRGCTKVSPGCAHCYAETFAERFRGVPGHAYEQGFDLRLVPEKLAEPLRWKKPRRIFVNSMSDLFQDGVPDEYIDRVFAVMALAPQHTFQVLTKRAARMRDYFRTPADLRDRIAGAILDPRDKPWWGDMRRSVLGNPSPAGIAEGIQKGWRPIELPNVWLGVSVENQHFADERIPLLLQTPAAVRFISAEPLLGPVDLWNLRGNTFDGLTGCGDRERLTEWEDTPSLDWVIVGGESGPGARPFDLAWARTLVQQCQAAGVPVFVKQLGAAPRFDRDESIRFVRSRKGNDLLEWPEDLRIRQFPEALGTRQGTR